MQHVVHPKVAAFHGSWKALVEWFLIRAKGQGHCLEREGLALMVCLSKEMYLLIPSNA